jgi:hypothetical protein
MYANELPEYVKMCLDGHHHISCGAFDFDVFVMAKPKTGILDDIFNQMYRQLELVNSVFIMIYSDDQVYGGNVHGFSFLYNVDISSNDSSQDKPAFLFCALAMACFNPAGAIGLIKQCRLPIRVCNPAQQWVAPSGCHPIPGNGKGNPKGSGQGSGVTAPVSGE